MNYIYRTRWSGQGCINRLIIISIIMYVLKERGIVGGRYFCNLKLKHTKIIGDCHSFLGEGGLIFLQFVILNICHTSHREGVLREIWQVFYTFP